jgi:hypothetical protein
MRLPNLARLSLRPTGAPKRPRSPSQESEDTVLSDDDEDGEFELPVEEGKAKIYTFRWPFEGGDKPDCVLRFVAECRQTPWRTLDTEVDFKQQDYDNSEVVWLHISLASTQTRYSERGGWAIAVPLLKSPTRTHGEPRTALEALINRNEPLEACAAKYEAGQECVGHGRLVARYLIATDYILNDLLPGAPAVAVERDIAIADRFEPAKLLQHYQEQLPAVGGDVDKALAAAYFAAAAASYWRSRYYQTLGAHAYFVKDSGKVLRDDEAIQAAVVEMVVRMRANPVLQRWREEVKALAQQQPPQPPGPPKKRSTHEYWPTAYGLRFRMPLTGAHERLVREGRVRSWAGDVVTAIQTTTPC